MNGLINLRTAIIWHSQVSCKSQSIISTDSISCSKDLVELWCSHTFDPSPTSGLYSPIWLPPPPPPQKKKKNEGQICQVADKSIEIHLQQIFCKQAQNPFLVL